MGGDTVRVPLIQIDVDSAEPVHARRERAAALVRDRAGSDLDGRFQGIGCAHKGREPNVSV
jgi:hypothetical protein